MAGPAHADDEYHRGQMDIHEQRSTYDLFMGLTKWSSLAIAALLVFLTLLFATEAGLMASTLATVVLIAAGIYFLREKKTSKPNPNRPGH
jgi:glucose uptake protein GlcU